jgi:hypothetical protein
MLSPRLDRALFSISLQLIAVRIPARKCNAFMQRLSGHVLQRPKIKPIQPDGDQPSGSTRLLLLAEGVSDLALTGLPEELRQYVQQEGGEAVQHNVQLGYDKFSTEQVLRKLLPEGMEVPSAFEQIGHIAHVNLRDELLPYKAIIGEVRPPFPAGRQQAALGWESVAKERSGRCSPLQLGVRQVPLGGQSRRSMRPTHPSPPPALACPS